MVTSASSATTSLTYTGGQPQASLVLVRQEAVDHAKAQGRIAFSIPSAELPGLGFERAVSNM